MKKQQPKIAVIDDDEDLLFALKRVLQPEFGGITSFSHPEHMLDQIDRPAYQVILLDMNFRYGNYEGQEGLDYLQQLQHEWPQCEIVTLTAFADVALAVKAVKQGAFDFITKPWKKEQLISTIEQALQSTKLPDLHSDRGVILQSNQKPDTPILGDSKAAENMRGFVASLSGFEGVVQLSGAKGAGRKLLAQHIHAAYSKGRLVKLSSGGLEKHDNLLVDCDKKELKEHLHRATNLPELLFWITETVQEIEDLATKTVELAPLNERENDVLLLAEYYLQKLALKHGKSLKLSNENREMLKEYSWGENVSELQLKLEEAVVLSNGKELNLSVLRFNNWQLINQPTPTLAEVEKRYVEHVLKNNGGNISKSAKELGLTRAALYRRIEKFGIEI